MKRLRTSYVLVASQTLSIIGSRMTSIAVGIRVFADTGDTAPLLLTSFFNELPAMLGSSFAGVLADRWNRVTPRRGRAWGCCWSGQVLSF